MATTVRPLNGADGYLRWKESMLLRLHTAGVAYVLSDDPPPPASGDAAAAARKWARDDAVCRGHILAALSDRIFPDYVRHGTARAAWDAVARTYDVRAGIRGGVPFRVLDELEFDADGGAPLLEQIAHAEAVNATIKSPLPDERLAGTLCEKLPEAVRVRAIARSSVDSRATTMDDVWHAALIWEGLRVRREYLARSHDMCGNCSEPGHHAGDCMG